MLLLLGPTHCVFTPFTPPRCLHMHISGFALPVCVFSFLLVNEMLANTSRHAQLQRPAPSALGSRPIVAPRARSSRSMRRQATLLDTLLQPLTSLNKVADLKQGIASFYDESSALWEEMWGEHMHHGYYPKDSPPKSNQQAQIDMIEESLSHAGVTSVKSMVDVGCGIGGSSRYIARKFGCTAKGITLSPQQAKRANEITARMPEVAGKASFQVADALAQPFDDNSFDLVWSMESGEHMPDKAKFVGELARVCAPGGHVIVVTWCHRVLAPGEALRPEESSLLDRICEAYYLPAWCSVEDYRQLFKQQGLVDIKVSDWSNEVAPFWNAVIRTALTSQGVVGLLRAGWTTIKGALVMPLMAQGFQMGLIKFNVITARKQSSS